jgi:hypothetical protein
LGEVGDSSGAIAIEIAFADIGVAITEDVEAVKGLVLRGKSGSRAEHERH